MLHLTVNFSTGKHQPYNSLRYKSYATLMSVLKATDIASLYCALLIKI